jgi:hypothetical protein
MEQKRYLDPDKGIVCEERRKTLEKKTRVKAGTG